MSTHIHLTNIPNDILITDKSSIEDFLKRILKLENLSYNSTESVYLGNTSEGDGNFCSIFSYVFTSSDTIYFARILADGKTKLIKSIDIYSN